MATKDWKEQKFDTSGNHTIYKDYHKTRAAGIDVNRIPAGYSIFIFDNKLKKPIDRKFKTKTKALAYAKAYMRKH